MIKERRIEELTRTLKEEHSSFMGLIGTSPAMRRVFEQVENASKSEAPVIILGESGTGKELVAGAIHSLGKRGGGPFVKVNCAALSEHILESELFGHKRGAFTGAMQDRRGRFEAASGGTFFLDEIGDMPISMQVKLLRVLEEKEIERVGENEPVAVDIRLITATNRDINALVEEGSFREDLLYRVNVIPISVPPLRERMEDLPLLINHFLERISLVNNKHIRRLSPRAMEVLENFRWPGNIRQLINALEYSAITCRGDAIEAPDLPDYVFVDRRRRDAPPKAGLGMERITGALERSGGNRTLAAEYLGISRVTLWKKLKELGR